MEEKRKVKRLPIGQPFWYAGNGVWQPAYGEIIGYKEYKKEFRYVVKFLTKRYFRDTKHAEVHPEAFEPHTTQCYKTLEQLYYEAQFEQMIMQSAVHP